MNDKQFLKYLMRKTMRGEVVSLKGQQMVAAGPYRVILEHEGVPVILERNRFQHRLFDTREALMSWALEVMMQFEVTFMMTDSDGNESTFQQMGSSLDDDFVDDGRELPPDCWVPSLR